MKTLSLKYILAIIMLLGIFIFNACNTKGNDKNNRQDENITFIKTQELKSEPFIEYISVLGVAKAEMMASISSDEGGKIKKFYKEKGSYVQKDEVILEIDNDVLKANLGAAKAQYDKAESNFSRQEKIYNENVSSELQYFNAKYDRDAALANYELIKARYNKTFIKAPFAGYFDSKMYEVGETVLPSMPVITLVKMDRVKIEAGVPENYVNHVRLGNNVKIVFKDLGGIEYNSKLTYVGNAISTTNRTFPVEVILNNYDRKIKPELSAMVYIEKNNFENVVIVPEEVVVKTDLGYVVFIEVNGIAKMKTVEVISRYNSMAAIKSGLSSGDKLITVGYQNLVDGEKVKVVN